MSNFFYDQDLAFIPVEEGVKRKIKAYDGKLMMVEVYFEKQGRGPAKTHAHPHEQVTYCLEGEIEFTVGEEVKIVKAGDTVYIPANLPHGTVLKSEKGRVLDVFTPLREDFLK